MTLAVWWATCLIWSTVWLAIKVGVSTVPPFGFAALRLGIALVVLGGVTVARGTPFPRAAADVRLIAFTGFLLLGVNYIFVYWGAQYISSGLTAILQATTPVFSMLLAHVLLRDEPITRVRVLALLSGLAGVTLIFWTQVRISGPRELLGAVAVTAGAACVAWAYVLVRRSGSHLDTTTLIVGQMVSGFIPLLVLSLALEGNVLAAAWTPAAIAALLYLALAGSVAAFWLNYWLLRRMGATDVLLMAVVEPMLAVALGAAVLGERITFLTAAGSLCVLGSVALALRRPATSGGVVAGGRR